MNVNLNRKQLLYFSALFLCIVFITICGNESISENIFSCSLNHDIISFSANPIQMNVPGPGSYRITIRDDTTVYRILEGVSQNSGTVQIEWDGTGFNNERLDKRNYLIDAIFVCEDGTHYSYSFTKASEYSAQAVNYALPSSDTIWLESADNWFLETKTVMDGTLSVEWNNNETGTVERVTSISVSGGKPVRFTYKSLTGGYNPEPGEYSLWIYDSKNKEYGKRIKLNIVNQKSEDLPLQISEEFMPSGSDDNEEIWRKMMLPSVVVNIGFHQHQKIYAKPDKKTKSLGTVHGQTQALKILDLKESWALVGAWNHETGSYIEGWVPSDNLKIEKPQSEYGLLFDKKTQILTVYYHGKVYDSIKISTGLSENGKLYQETSAGSFLTGYHRSSFSSNGKKYDYVIQYDGGNMIHQIPYYWGNGKKNFSAGSEQLGNKASHGCIRIQAEPSEKEGINAYWIWTHIPYHTRVVILDNE